ncbi:hypothetical protein Tco_0828582, partial [Tanacetum coccineum]
LIKEIQDSTNATIRNQGASIKTLEIQIGQMSKCDEKKGLYGTHFLEANSYGASHIDNSIPRKEKDPGSFTLPCYINNVCFDNALADLGAIVSVVPLSTYLNLGLGKLAHTKLMVELADRTMKHPKGIAENVLVGIGKFVFPVYFIKLDMPEDVKVPLILGRPFLSTAHTKIDVFKRKINLSDVFKRKITLRVGDEKIIFKRVYMLGLRERVELDLEARLMGETLVLNRSLDPLYGDYIELNDINVSLEHRRDQVDGFMPTIGEGEVIDEPKIDIIKTRNGFEHVNAKSFNSATYGVFEEGRRMKVPVERSMNEDILPQKEKHPGSFTLPCYINNVCFEKALADLGCSVSVMPLTTFTNLGERMKLDLEARLMGEALMINRSQDPSFKDFIELNDLNTPIELRRNQVEDLGPTIGEEEVIDKPDWT